MEKTSFILYAEQLEQVKLLKMEERGILLTALMMAAGGEDPTEILAASGSAMMAYSFIRAQIARDKAKFEETSARRKAAGSHGGTVSGEARRQQAEDAKQTEAKRSKTKQNEANGSKAKQTKQNETETETETDSKSKESKERKTAPTPADIFLGLLPSLSPEDAQRVTASFDAFAEMRKKIKAPLTNAAIKTAADELNKIFRDKHIPFTADMACAILDQSTFKAWRGLFELKGPDQQQAPAARTKTGIHYSGERNYDWDALEQRMRRQGREERQAMAKAPP